MKLLYSLRYLKVKLLFSSKYLKVKLLFSSRYLRVLLFSLCILRLSCCIVQGISGCSCLVRGI